MTDKFKLSFELRVLANIEISPEGCWLYTGPLLPSGYAQISMSKNIYIHRASFEYHKKAIPDGLEIDHACHKPNQCNLRSKCPHRRCVNPDHLEAVTKQGNMRRRRLFSHEGIPIPEWKTTHCEKGHPFNASNTHLRLIKKRWLVRVCRECSRICQQTFQAKKKLLTLASIK